MTYSTSAKDTAVSTIQPKLVPEVSCLLQSLKMALSSNPWTVDKLEDMYNHTVIYPDDHLLGLPQELRNRIYDRILSDIQQSPRTWNQKSCSKYDSMLLVCKQLYLESSQNIFMGRVTKASLPRILGLLPNRANVGLLRALSLQVSYQASHQTIQCIATILDKFQLSIQELHLSFYDQDLHGNSIEVNGCGHVSKPSQNSHCIDLPPSGQDIDTAFALQRQITNLRNLRVLHIENLNLPVIQYVLFSNKPKLQAVCFVTDSRAQVCDFKKVYRKRPDLFKGMLGGPLSKPPVKVLELDANAIVPAQVVVNTLSSTLEHFSWRVPNYDHQFEPETTLNSFEHITSGVLRNLSVGSPDLNSLRLCFTRRATSPGQQRFSWETSATSQVLAQHLPSYLSLEHFEIHDSYPEKFYEDTLISSLPYGLKRLYISERLININTLVRQVRERYIVGKVDDDFDFEVDTAYIDGFNEEQHEIVDDTVCMLISDRGYIRFPDAEDAENRTSNELLVVRSLSKSGDHIARDTMLGEAQTRQDRITLHTGKLGFVTFDFDISTDEQENVKFGNEESTRTKIFKLNGQLLDREHNMHLAAGREPLVLLDGSIKPKLGDMSARTSAEDETEVLSSHPEIYQGLHKMAQLRWHPERISENAADLKGCFDNSMDWYFGAEVEAEKVFRTELVAAVQDQKQKSMPIEIEPYCSKRCQWSAPEYVMPPVGTFPTPVVPRDWRDDIEKKS